jgi:hypothetical protein
MFCDIYFIYYQIETEGFASTRLPTSELGSRRAWLYRKPGMGFNGLAPRPRHSWNSFMDRFSDRGFRSRTSMRWACTSDWNRYSYNPDTRTCTEMHAQIGRQYLDAKWAGFREMWPTARSTARKQGFWHSFFRKDERQTFLMRDQDRMRALTRTLSSSFSGLMLNTVREPYHLVSVALCWALYNLPLIITGLTPYHY